MSGPIEPFNTQHEAVHRDAWIRLGLERGWTTEPVWDAESANHVLPLTFPPTEDN